MAVSAWVGAFGPWVVAGAAIWGERIRAAVLRPNLHLKLASNVGEITEQAMMEGDRVTELLPARYFHLRVINRRRFPAAHEVQIFMTKLEIPGPDGQPRLIYSVPLPFMWQYQELYPNPLRTIGYTTVAQAAFFCTTWDATVDSRVGPEKSQGYFPARCAFLDHRHSARD
jgi:hypothetical protein